MFAYQITQMSMMYAQYWFLTNRKNITRSILYGYSWVNIKMTQKRIHTHTHEYILKLIRMLTVGYIYIYMGV